MFAFVPPKVMGIWAHNVASKSPILGKNGQKILKMCNLHQPLQAQLPINSNELNFNMVYF
jgi:hypothetical protein